MSLDVALVSELPPFRRATLEDLSAALSAFVVCEFGPGEVIMREGEADRTLAVVIRGELSVHVGEKRLEVGRLGRGSMLGEMAVFSSYSLRAATVVTCSDCTLMILDQKGLERLRNERNLVALNLEDYALRILARRLRQTNQQIAEGGRGGPLPPEDERLMSKLGSFIGTPAMKAGPKPDRVAALRTIPALAKVDEASLKRIAKYMDLLAAPPGFRIIEQGAPGSDAYILISGAVDVFQRAQKGSERVARLRGGRLFGMVAMVDGKPRSATCIASEPSWLLCLPRTELERMDERAPLEAALFRRAIFDALADNIRRANTHLDLLNAL